ncbi:MAG TPA: trehalose-6-phosphate synthase [Gaiellaceae bacterium]|nr:trehalose-6-phosphate synthase [Actinomycetota bacterium]HSL63479.1 trehalose-6-phosphate synthase [Gaiellaceae bacterium]
MAGRRNLIVVSNRGPVTYGRDLTGARVARRGGGGLVTALRSLVSHHDVTWIASAMSDEDKAVAAEAAGAVEETARDGSPYRLRLVVHGRPQYDWFYNVVANPTLWFLQHYLWDLVSHPSLDPGLLHAWERGYVPVNRGFADAVLSELEAQPDATVFFHDYHLYLAPRFVRDERPDAALAHFVHVPWPQSDYWHVLHAPIRRAIHAGLLANDVVGFHTERWARNFRRCARDILGEGALGDVRVTAHPISVDAREFDELKESPAVRTAERLLESERPERLVLRVDRTDPSKNVVRGFRAFELYLESHPEAQGRVGMLALLDPSRQDIPEYAEYLGAIQREARRVNDRFQSDGWKPIDLRIEDDFAASVAAYKQYDVLLVNAIFDGLNLVAKEAPLVNERDGVLVLSENAGAYEEVGDWALGINPFDVAGQADAIHEALEMSAAERHRRLAGIRSWVREHDLEHWIQAQLDDFDRGAVRRRPGLARVRRG